MKKILIKRLILLAGLILFAVENTPASSKIVILPEVEDPQSIHLDGDQIYLIDGARIFIYRREGCRLQKIFGQTGEKPSAFRPRQGGKIRLFLNAQSENLIICSQERTSVFSKQGDFIKLLDVPYMVDYVVPFLQGFIGSAYHIKVGTGKSTQHILLAEQGIDFLHELAGSKLGGGSAKGFGGPDRKLHFDLIRDFFGFRAYRNRIYVGDSAKGTHFEVFDSEGKKLYEINRDYQKQVITTEEARELKKILQAGSTYQNYPDSVIIDEREFWPAFKTFEIDEDRLYIFTHKRNEDRRELIIMDLKGNPIQTIFVPESKVYSISGGFYFFLLQNRDQEWELHKLDLSGGTPHD